MCWETPLSGGRKVLVFPLGSVQISKAKSTLALFSVELMLLRNMEYIPPQSSASYADRKVWTAVCWWEMPPTNIATAAHWRRFSYADRTALSSWYRAAVSSLV